MSRRRVDDSLNVERVGLAARNHPAGWMAQHVHLWVLERTKQTVGHLVALHAERRVDRCDDDVEGGEAVVREVHRAVGPDVALDAGEYADAETLGIHLPDLCRVGQRAALIEA